MIEIKKGLDLPIEGGPKQSISEGRKVNTVALVGYDYNGMKPTMQVSVGDTVKLGQPVFTCKKTAGVVYTAPGAGTVVAVNRGDKRVFQSLVIELDGSDDSVEFAQHSDLSALTRETVQSQLLESGAWTSLQTRPFNKVPVPGSVPSSIFVSAMDTNPLAADPTVVIGARASAFNDGLNILSQLTDGKVYVGHAASAQLNLSGNAQVQAQAFAGPHPAGLVGTHIHHLDPVSESKTVWTITYQDVIALSALFKQGRLDVERVVALAGPEVSEPRLITTRVGANLQELTAGETRGNQTRVISGSILGGRTAHGAVDFLGRYHLQVSCLLESTEREMFHYLRAGKERHSVMPIYVSWFNKARKFAFNTTTNGSERAMVPVGAYERVMPLDVLPTQLLRSLIVGDTDGAIGLGALEMAEEDLALCTYVCPGKYEYGPILRDTLTTIEKEG
ncbi:Na(+)-translocating NADH-quinone reductase subunit A [Litorivicinus lipolyticus]|uniref:Na(+)-translocating NADH-quinone reductase subunit A n=1 Tax=Litorivicinus lipolyticus TaxID=418701 RepID=A0A5Q2QDK9_9GAMM|nr:Na(+)-translocating NADH-quinone reductase subunit A [Litorivicinus lipolyticus]QGG79940.1 Na(+)-translocating NADH-quinone reductase subunit A [Litorivicinus lipolyticus]